MDSVGAPSLVAALVPQMPFVCILRCSDGTFCVRHTDNLAAGIVAHNDGTGSAYVPVRRPVELVHGESHTSLESAVARERQLKRWNAEKKEALVSDDAARLMLACRRASPLAPPEWPPRKAAR